MEHAEKVNRKHGLLFFFFAKQKTWASYTEELETEHTGFLSNRAHRVPFKNHEPLFELNAMLHHDRPQYGFCFQH
jgi:hypothetical protein